MATINRRMFARQIAQYSFGGVLSLNGYSLLKGGMQGGLALAQENARDSVKPDLYFHPGDPRNGEPALAKLVETWMTPVSQFYVRSHGLNPKIDLANYRVRIEGLVDHPGSWTLNELAAKLPLVSVTCTLTCAGNRRSEHSQMKPVGGVQWREGAIGNAKWEGYKLSDVLQAAGIQEGARHVWFEGVDEVKDGNSVFPFGGSVPLAKVFDEQDGVAGAILATKMNGEVLTEDHGFPIRTVVPGYIGARSVKWLGKIVVSDRPSPNHFVQDVYKMLQADTAVQRDEAAPIYRYPVNSVTCLTEQVTGAKATVKVRGYALPTGLAANRIKRVELSIDGGRNWRDATLGSEAADYCWQLWEGEIGLSGKPTELLVRATDSAGYQQPERVIWHPKGYLYNGWHRTTL
ncbi:MAG: molybdopterin-dependent oxidoreductase [Planctomyces sp.]|nr:molybdopterin-dependent oxidoreductase [Planctomyces sp.]